ncbi:DUF1697 domain-containing protein [Candidatus Bathyarchaeota archaeon]|nr:MAG: DUF1697 domain-containing protein [Candidatus Bathyarchaeota archaeon]
MPAYIAMLRGINVSGQKVIRMDHSRTVHWSWLSECRDVRSEWKHRLSDPDRKSGSSLETDRRDNPPLLWI